MESKKLKLKLSKKTIAILNNQEMMGMQGGTYTMLDGTCTCNCGLPTNAGCTGTIGCPSPIGGGAGCQQAYNTGACATSGPNPPTPTVGCSTYINQSTCSGEYQTCVNATCVSC